MRKKHETIFDYLKRKYSHPAYESHKAPITRRDLIKLGALAGGAFALPSLFPSNTWAATRPHIPFLCFDLAGGLGLPANFLVGQRGGPDNLCDKYQQHGWDPREGVDKTFGLPMSAKSSRILTGLQATLPEEILNQGSEKYFQMASMATFSLDDGGETPLSALSMVSKAGLVGEKLKSGISLNPTLSGGHSAPFLNSTAYRPQYISNLNDIRSMTSLGSAFTNLPEETKSALFKQFAEHGIKYPELLTAYQDLRNFGTLHEEGDPTKATEVREVYDDLDNNEVSALRAAVAYNVLKGFTGPGVITIEECDYHDNTSFTGDLKDEEFGRELGRVIALAHKLQTPLFIHIITDGGVYSDSESFNRIWLGDQSLHSLSVIGFYDPTKQTEQLQLQLGHYTPGGELSLSPNNPVANEAQMIQAVMINYLGLHGLEGNIQQLTGIRVQPETIDLLRVFG
ncbi:MAG: twin-arginine translocation signal domain-containing protein [Bdellovibrionales bacterium]